MEIPVSRASVANPDSADDIAWLGIDKDAAVRTMKNAVDEGVHVFSSTSVGDVNMIVSSGGTILQAFRYASDGSLLGRIEVEQINRYIQADFITTTSTMGGYPSIIEGTKNGTVAPAAILRGHITWLRGDPATTTAVAGKLGDSGDEANQASDHLSTSMDLAEGIWDSSHQQPGFINRANALGTVTTLISECSYALFGAVDIAATQQADAKAARSAAETGVGGVGLTLPTADEFSWGLAKVSDAVAAFGDLKQALDKIATAHDAVRQAVRNALKAPPFGDLDRVRDWGLNGAVGNPPPLTPAVPPNINLAGLVPTVGGANQDDYSGPETQSVWINGVLWARGGLWGPGLFVPGAPIVPRGQYEGAGSPTEYDPSQTWRVRNEATAQMLAIWALATARGTPPRPGMFPLDVNWEVRNGPGFGGKRMDIVTGRGPNPSVYEVKVYTGPQSIINAQNQAQRYATTDFPGRGLQTGSELAGMPPIPYPGVDGGTWVMWPTSGGAIMTAPIGRVPVPVRVKLPRTVPVPVPVPVTIPVHAVEPKPVQVPDDVLKPVLPDWRVTVAVLAVPVIVAGVVLAPAVTIGGLVGGGAIAVGAGAVNVSPTVRRKARAGRGELTLVVDGVTRPDAVLDALRQAHPTLVARLTEAGAELAEQTPSFVSDPFATGAGPAIYADFGDADNSTVDLWVDLVADLAAGADPDATQLKIPTDTVLLKVLEATPIYMLVATPGGTDPVPASWTAAAAEWLKAQAPDGGKRRYHGGVLAVGFPVPADTLGSTLDTGRDMGAYVGDIAPDKTLRAGVAVGATPPSLAVALPSPGADDATDRVATITQLLQFAQTLEPPPAWAFVSVEEYGLGLPNIFPARLTPPVPGAADVIYVLFHPHLGVADAYPAQLIRRDLLARTSIDLTGVPVDQALVPVILGDDPALFTPGAPGYAAALAGGRALLAPIIASAEDALVAEKARIAGRPTR